MTTTACNLNCKHCLRGDVKVQQLPFDILEKAVTGAKRFGLDSIHLTGGEPFLYEALPQVLKMAQDNDIPVTFSTNGLLLKKNAELIERYKKTIRLLNISLDSLYRDIHEKIRGVGTFEQVLGAFDFCRSRRLPFGILTCLNKLNCEGPINLVRFARKHKASQIFFSTALPCTNTKDNELILSEQQRSKIHQELIRLSRVSSMDFFRLFYVPVYIAESIFASNNIVMCNNQSLRVVTLDVDGSVHFCCFMTQYDLAGEVEKRLRIVSLRDVSFHEGFKLFSENIHRLLISRIEDFNDQTSQKKDADFNSCFYCYRKLSLL
ncbi:MAG: radical SAM protein [Candidatus Omnitrophota bacterium]